MPETNKIDIRLFCDSETAFQKLVDSEQISDDVRVYTRSFVMESNPKINSVYLDELVSDHSRREFKSAIFALEKKIESKLDTNAISFSHKLIFLQTYNQFQSDLLDGIMLDKLEEYSGKTFIIQPLTEQSGIDNITRPNWINWLSEDSNTSVQKISIPFHNERAARGNVKTNLFDRLRLGGIEAIVWKLFKSNLIPSLFFKNSVVGLVGQTEIMKDYVASSIWRGILPGNLISPPINSTVTEPDFDTADRLLTICKALLDDRLTCLNSKTLRARASSMFRKRLATELSTYKQQLKAWDNILGGCPKLKYIFSGYQKGAKARALADMCHKHKMQIISCQHGITRELLENVTERSVFFENSFCDIFIAANIKSAKLTESLRRENKELKAVVCAPPKELMRAKARKQPKFDALFISTTLYSGHKPNGVPPSTDKTLSEKDKALVERVFSKTNKTVHYKPYPSIRQLDRDPVFASVRVKPNMKIVGTHEELRYMLSDYRMVITTRATSTVSWAAASGRPLVFIDHFSHARLSNTAREAFEKAFFLFDQRDQNFHEDLGQFLDLPFADIEAQWAEKSLFREKTLHEFFTANSANSIYESFNSF